MIDRTLDYITVLESIAENAELRSTEKIVGILLVTELMRGSGKMRVRINGLAQRAGVSRSTVWRALKVLCSEDGPFEKETYYEHHIIEGRMRPSNACNFRLRSLSALEAFRDLSHMLPDRPQWGGKRDRARP